MKGWMRAGVGPAVDFSLSKLAMLGPVIRRAETRTTNGVQTKGAHVPAASAARRIEETSLMVAIPAAEESKTMRKD